jgi:glycine cleavage system H protein
MHPSELKYSPQNMWLKSEHAGVLRLGITYHYQGQLKNIVFLEPFGTIESSKTSSDLISPISGRVLEVNPAVLEKPGLINKEPYGQGWMILLQPNKPLELQSLLSSKQYVALTAAQI